MDVPFDLWGQRGRPGVDVVGESHYADAIRDVFGSAFQPGGCELLTTAQLVPEPWNRHDPGAVAVWVGERQVGYLPRHDAGRYSPVLSRLIADGWLPQVAARLWAASDYRGRSGLTGSVQIDLAEPHLIAPVNRPPSRPHRLLPPGHAIQVTGEESYADALRPLLGPEGECWAHVTLHELIEPLPQGSRSMLEVRLDGAPAGHLTPRMSAELLPAVRRLAANHQLTAARALLKGPKPELLLYAARAHELPDSWLDTVPPPAGRTALSSPAAATPSGWSGPAAVTPPGRPGPAKPSAAAAPAGWSSPATMPAAAAPPSRAAVAGSSGWPSPTNTPATGEPSAFPSPNSPPGRSNPAAAAAPPAWSNSADARAAAAPPSWSNSAETHDAAVPSHWPNLAEAHDATAPPHWSNSADAPAAPALPGWSNQTHAPVAAAPPSWSDRASTTTDAATPSIPGSSAPPNWSNPPEKAAAAATPGRSNSADTPDPAARPGWSDPADRPGSAAPPALSAAAAGGPVRPRGAAGVPNAPGHWDRIDAGNSAAIPAARLTVVNQSPPVNAVPGNRPSPHAVAGFGPAPVRPRPSAPAADAAAAHPPVPEMAEHRLAAADHTAVRARAAVPARTTPRGPASAGPPAQHGSIPPRPAGVRFTVPPGWPEPPEGWTPPTGWRPNPSWPPAPPDWQWWSPYWD